MKRQDHMTRLSTGGNRSSNDTRWSDRYSRGGGGAAIRVQGTSRLATFMLVALAVALVGLLIFGIPALHYRNQSETTFVNRMLTECNEAVSSTGTLSRLGGSESAAILGKIRANIRAVDAINDVNNSLGGGYFVEPGVFTELYRIIDSYTNNLRLGNVTLQNLTDLDNLLHSLRDELIALR